MNHIKEIIECNARKQKETNKPYNQITGEGCLGNRVCLRVEDAPCFVMSDSLNTEPCTFYLPKEMMQTNVCKLLQKYGSVKKLFVAAGEELSLASYLAFWTMFCELRIVYDFEYFAIAYETIEDGITAEDIPFTLKRGQRELLRVLEEMRLSGVPIRVIIVKARQLGLSTLTQLYMLWIQIVHKKNWHSVICAHVKDSATNIRAMFDKVIDNMPVVGKNKYSIAPYKNTQNIKTIPERGCRITVGSAEKPESVRGQNPKLAHFSEVGLYPNTEKKGTGDLIGSIIGAMKREPYTMVAYESTAKGVGDFFHTEWEKAKSGETPFEPVFLPWYYIDYYTESFDGTFYNHSGKKVKGSVEDFIRSMNEYELGLFTDHKECTLENINWYRGKNAEMSSDELMKQEYPSDDTEAFQDSGLPAFRSVHIEEMRKDCTPPVSIGDLVADCTPAMARTEGSKRKAVLCNIRYVEDKEATDALRGSDPKLKERKERNKLKVWEFPDTSVKISDRYVVVYDPQKGLSEKADWGVITVLDRYWMMYKGKPEVVAEWRGKIDKDIAIWLSAQIAKFYCDALLVIESNTFESDVKYDNSEFIFGTIADYYDNLYSRTPADKIKEGVPAVYGWHTNVKTKPMIIDNYVVMLREKGYVERNGDALNEARYYEQKKNGSFGAKDGKHDDILMTRMIGCQICYELPLPKEIAETPQRKGERLVGESSF